LSLRLYLRQTIAPLVEPADFTASLALKRLQLNLRYFDCVDQGLQRINPKARVQMFLVGSDELNRASPVETVDSFNVLNGFTES